MEIYFSTINQSIIENAHLTKLITFALCQRFAIFYLRCITEHCLSHTSSPSTYCRKSHAQEQWAISQIYWNAAGVKRTHGRRDAAWVTGAKVSKPTALCHAQRGRQVGLCVLRAEEHVVADGAQISRGAEEDRKHETGSCIIPAPPAGLLA